MYDTSATFVPGTSRSPRTAATPGGAHSPRSWPRPCVPCRPARSSPSRGSHSARTWPPPLTVGDPILLVHENTNAVDPHANRTPSPSGPTEWLDAFRFMQGAVSAMGTAASSRGHLRPPHPQVVDSVAGQAPLDAGRAARPA